MSSLVSLLGRTHSLLLSSDDIQAILDMVEDPGYIVQEIATGGRMANWVLPYISNGDVTAFSYTEAMGELIRQRSWADLAPTGWFWNSREFIPSSEALIFVDNHDRQRGSWWRGSYFA